MTDTTIVASGDIAASPRTEQIVDVPAFVPPETQAQAPEAKATETPASTEQSLEEVAAKEEKKRNGYKEKLERERARATDLEAKLAEATKSKTEDAPADKEPKPEEFETWDAYYKAAAKYEARQEFAALTKEQQAKAKEESLKTEFADKQKQYAAKADELKAATPDFDEVINSYDGPLTAPMQQALLESDIGPQVAYYLAKNPEEGEVLAQMGVLALNKAIGRIEAKIEAGMEQPAPQPKPKVTNAPPPISPVGKSAANGTVDPYNAPTDHEDYMKWRAKQK